MTPAVVTKRPLNQPDVRGLNDIRVEAFNVSHLPLVAAFSEKYWSRPRTEAFYRWRYIESQAFSRLFVAITGNECLGMVCGLRKPYLIAGERTNCVDIFDWHCLPGLKGSGVGIRVMRAMMRSGDRVLGFGGTADVLSALPAMGWQRIGTLRMFELPLAGTALQPALQKRVPLRLPGETLLLDAAARAWFRPRRRARPVSGDAVAVPMIDSAVMPLYEGETGYDLVQVPQPELIEWMRKASNGAEFGFLYFTVQGRIRGWAMTRVYDTPEGLQGDILDLYAPEATVGLYTWMVSEALLALRASEPRMIRARSSCPNLQAALRANRFIQGQVEIPLQTWPGTLPAALRSHITLNHSDEPLRPYGSRDATAQGRAD